MNSAPPDDPEGDDPDSGANGDAGPEVVFTPLCDPARAIATGRGVTVTAGEVYELLRDAPAPLLRRYSAEPALLQELADRLVSDRLLALEARRRGLERDPIVRAALERALVSRLRSTVIDPRGGEPREVTDEDARLWFDAHPERFHVPERRRARVIFVTDRRDAQNYLRMVQLRRRGRPVHDFRRMATEHTTDPELRASRGEIRDVTLRPSYWAPDLDDALREAVFIVGAEGEILPRIVPARWRTTEGFFVVRWVGRRAAIERTFAESAEWIRQRLVLERRVQAERAEVDRLAGEHGVTRVPLDQVLRLSATTDAGAPRR